MDRGLPTLGTGQSDGNGNYGYFPHFDWSNSPGALQMNWNSLVNDNTSSRAHPPYPQPIDATFPPSPPNPNEWSSGESSGQSLSVPSASTVASSPRSEPQGSVRGAQDSRPSGSEQRHHQQRPSSQSTSNTRENHIRNRDNGNSRTIPTAPSAPRDHDVMIVERSKQSSKASQPEPAKSVSIALQELYQGNNSLTYSL